jgi:hypothetical protein
MGALLEPHPLALGAHAIGLLAIAMIALAVYARAILGEGYALERLGFRHVSWVTPLLAIALTAFFVLVVGPIAYWVLARACGDPDPHRDRPLRDRPGAISNALHAELTEVPWRLWVIRPPTAWSMTCPGASAAFAMR